MAVSSEEQMMIDLVAEFIDEQVKPTVNRVEHANEYPESWIETMKDMGIYGLAIDEPWGMGKVSTEAYALITQELARGWMSLAGAMGGHTVVAKLIQEYGTTEQKDNYLPRMATGELRATMALTEPGGGSDLQAMRTHADKDGDDYVINGSKTWITNARKSDLIALLCKTDPNAEPRHKGSSGFRVRSRVSAPSVSVMNERRALGDDGNSPRSLTPKALPCNLPPQPSRVL
ncbi:acyl-CoA dehydrogenase family protein [Brevibacterium sp. LE-L]|uniref:acyl-CoA dehydrogenase family protein n=1 Tax=Brevibacterium sp. LE-L TaxID=3418557 RepID=UPI003CF2410B